MLRLRRSWGEIVQQLSVAGALPTPQPPPPVTEPTDPAASPWFVRVLLGVAAWISALLALAAIGMAAAGMGGFLPIGAGVLAGGVLLLRGQSGEFLRQLGLAGSLAGQLALAIGLADQIRDPAALAAVALVAEGLLACFVTYPVHRFSSTLLAAIAGTVLLVSVRVPMAGDLAILMLAAAVGRFWLRQPARLRRAGVDQWTSMGHALVLALFGLLLFSLLGGVAQMDGLVDRRIVTGRLASAGLGLAIVALSLRISAEAGVPRPTPLHAAGLAAVALIGFVTPASPGVAAAAGVLLLGLHRRNPALVAVAIGFLFGFLGLLYYSLAASLLAKALHLMTAGLVLVVVAWLIRRGSHR